MTCDVALVTFSELPELDPDDRPLAAALAQRGHAVEIVPWDRPGFDWSSARLVVLRNPWDYFHRLDEFLGWAEATAAATEMWNPLETLRWNLHKRYLVELAERGAPVVPTLLFPAGSRDQLAPVLSRRGWERAIVKPAVSADSWRTLAVGPGDLAEGEVHFAQLLAERDVVLQPFLASVESVGERCLVFLDGEFSHAVRKNPLTRGGRWAGLPEGEPVEAEADELEAAAKVLSALPFSGLLYARVDLVRDDGGRPLLLEVELVEPTLFLTTSETGLERLVAGIESRLDGR